MVNKSYTDDLKIKLKSIPFELSVIDIGLIQYYWNYFTKEMATSDADFTPILHERIESILEKYDNG
jgi:hypothetical protein